MSDYEKYADLIRRVAQTISDERASKCGYDLFMGLYAGDVDDRFKVWENYLKEHVENSGHTETLRDGVWVPAIPL